MALCPRPRRHLKEARNAYDTQHKLHTFSVGVPNSPDLIAARKVRTHGVSGSCVLCAALQASNQSRKLASSSSSLSVHPWRQVADFLGTIHHEFTFTVEEGLDALEDLIWHIESFEQVSDLIHRTACESHCSDAQGHHLLRGLQTGHAQCDPRDGSCAMLGCHGCHGDCCIKCTA